MGSASQRARRPFWLHQVAEYLIGVVLVAAGVQSPSPVVPAVLGGLVLVNAAIVDGPVSAFDAVPRRVHRWIDVALIAGIAVAAVLPMLDIDVGTRVLLLLVAGVLTSVWWFSSFEARRRRTPATTGSGNRADDIGRSAGRAVGRGVNSWRQRRGDTR
jgi:hypothetical protein